MSRSSLLKRILFSVFISALTVNSAEVHAQGYRAGQCGLFTVAVIPDTQNYLDYRNQKTSSFPFDAVEMFYNQMLWVSDNSQGAGGDIVFATHVGDIWQHYSEWMDPAHAARGFRWMPNVGGSEVAASPKVQTKAFEIPNAVRGYQLIAGKLPFSVVPGNHDFDALWTDPRYPPKPELQQDGVRHVGGLKGFQSAFADSSDFFAGQPWYVSSNDDGADSAQLFTAGQCSFLHVGLQYHAPDASLKWAAGVISDYPGVPTIVSTHDYLARNGSRNAASNPDNSKLDPIDNSPEMIWEKLVSQHDQIFLVLSGHVGGQGFSVDTNRFGNPVWQMMADYQGRGQTATEAGSEGTRIGDGWLRLLKFRIDGPRPEIEVRTFSTHYGKFASEVPEYGAWYKAHDRQSALSDEDYLKRDEFTFELVGFAGRFEASADRATN